nr:NADH dehydrogenase subunit 2 [Moechotypa diphysis]
MMNFYKIMFLMCTILGTLITISSYSWLSIWIGLEINLLSIIPLFKSKENIYPTESALKYFLTQALASSILLLAIILIKNFNNILNIPPSMFTLLISTALATKMGAAPFHFWFPEVVEGLNWMNNFIMLTWQKIAPFIIFSQISKEPIFYLLVIMSSLIIGGMQGLNQMSLRKILAYSSINHISWMLSSLLYSQSIWTLYFMVYSIISLNIIILLHTFNIFYISQFNIFLSNKMIKILFMMNLMSLGGLPPFLGFLPKWLVINGLVMNGFFYLSVVLIIFTLITLYFYLRLMFSTLMLGVMETLIPLVTPLNFMIFLFNFITLSGLLFCTFMFDFL